MQGPSSSDYTYVSQSSIKVFENKILFYSDIDDDSALELNKCLIEMDSKLKQMKGLFNDDFNPKIHLHINSNGGGISSGFSILDTIRRLNTEVYTYVDGSAASAATFLTITGAKRFIGKHGMMLIHQLSGGIEGKHNELNDYLLSCNKTMDIIIKLYQDNTKMSLKKIKEFLNKDIWLTSDECLEYGLVDEII